MTYAELAWSAGFLEGEGSFMGSAPRDAFTVCASQVQREPLERLQTFYGGSIKIYINNRGTLYHRWNLHGNPAIAVAFTLYTFMSPRRREQIRHMVAKWKSRAGRGGKNAQKTQCPWGHAYTPDNIYWSRSRGRGLRRNCKECHRYWGKQPRRLVPRGETGPASVLQGAT